MVKKIIILSFFIIGLGVLAFNFDDITDKLAKVLRREPTVVISKVNSYYKNNGFEFVKESTNYIPYSQQDLKDIFYSSLNAGYETFTFYCPAEYYECLNDVHSFSSDNSLLTHINNFVSPFNNFDNIKVVYDETGEVTIKVNKLYSPDEISIINQEIDRIIASKLNSEMELEDKILTIHDYIINKTKYDEDRLSGIIKYKSNIAYGPLIEGYGICGGYSDAMALFLNRWNVPNFKVASDTHVWNAVFMGDAWLHLDLTWDDPVSEDRSKDTLLHKFYLIDTSTLESYEITDHDFNKTIYRELAN
ncbi:MAG: hypothetical protein PHG03_01825 [Bacilli bacterium]|nr:hypothetical protein [Bacilli bacterium]MDD4795284.1 hypothetical protein [Bacilli bacterium]